jgi:uncharacterized phage protein gp47/JayE
VALNFKTPTEVAEEYLTHLKGLKPEVNTAQTDSDWYIRSRVTGGIVSGAYADQQKVSNDAFPQNARRDALSKHLATYFDRDFNPATNAEGLVSGTGTSGTTAVAGSLEFVYEPNGNSYISTADVTIGVSGTYEVAVQSVGTGQEQNLLQGTVLSLSSPPAGFNSAAAVSSGPIADGRNEESEKEASDAILARIQNPSSGGKASDYEQWAKDADPSVVSASVSRWLYGLGSLGVIISAGTTDIDAALDNGDAIVLTPSQTLIDTVQAYIDDRKVETDCVHVLGAVEEPIDVTIKVKFATGDGSTVLSGQTLTQTQLVQREVKRAIYKTPVGGRKIDDIGYVMCSEIEEVVDLGLSAESYIAGKLEILLDRQVSDLSATGANRKILGNQIAVPGTITVVVL